ncbi:hypothetical protein PG985_007845 [Apiospora marii]|uniref:uncharacterized protein n=1 Tax=Apiospora marii TaxID=335849 RepID=UPI00312F5852
MPSTQQSFPQFTRLPAELQLEILGHHRDGSLVQRHHYIRGFHAGKPLERVKDYKCLDLHDPTHIITDEARHSGSSCSHDDDMTDCIYTNDGLASERILLDSSRSAFDAGNKGPRVFSHVWANMATDVFTFQDLSMPPPGPPPTPETFLGALADACPLVHGDHWFWRVRKLALEVSEASLATGYVLSAFDKDMLRRTTSALRTVYVVADRGCGDCGRLRCWTTSSGGYGNGAHLLRLPTGQDGFVASEDYFVRGAKPICSHRAAVPRAVR